MHTCRSTYKLSHDQQHTLYSVHYHYKIMHTFNIFSSIMLIVKYIQTYVSGFMLAHPILCI